MKEGEGIDQSIKGPNSDSESKVGSNDLSNEKAEEKELLETEPAEYMESLDTPPTTGLVKERHAFPLAMIIVSIFAVSIIASFVYLFWFASTFDNGLDLFKTVSAVLSGPLGFVLGFYFRVTETGS